MKKSWIDVKQQLLDKEHKELVNIIKLLYQADKGNQTFLYTHLALDKHYLEPYKEKIERHVFPDILAREDYSVVKAKKAISDYKKALGKPADIAELEVFYCECAGDFLESICLEDENFFLALERMFERAVKSVLALPPKQQKKYGARLNHVYRLSDNWGWGVQDELTDIIDEQDAIRPLFDL